VGFGNVRVAGWKNGFHEGRGEGYAFLYPPADRSRSERSGMKRVKLVVAAAMAFMLAGCVFRGKQPAKVAAVPPTPAPTAPATPPPPPEPLSIRQTQAQLPEPQPISPEALATIQRPEPPAEAQPEPRTKRPPARPTRRPPSPPT